MIAGAFVVAWCSKLLTVAVMGWYLQLSCHFGKRVPSVSVIIRHFLYQNLHGVGLASNARIPNAHVYVHDV